MPHLLFLHGRRQLHQQRPPGDTDRAVERHRERRPAHCQPIGGAGQPGMQQNLRLESFNVLNHFNWGDPVTNFNSGQFGRITSLAGTPPNGVYGTMRILQFGIKYDF